MSRAEKIAPVPMPADKQRPGSEKPSRPAAARSASPKPARPGRKRQVLVLVAMVVVAGALGSGLHHQLGVSLGLAVVSAGLALLGMLGLDMLVRRSEAARPLAAENARLQRELRTARSEPRAGAGAPATPSRPGAAAAPTAPLPGDIHADEAHVHIAPWPRMDETDVPTPAKPTLAPQPPAATADRAPIPRVPVPTAELHHFPPRAHGPRTQPPPLPKGAAGQIVAAQPAGFAAIVPAPILETQLRPRPAIAAAGPDWNEASAAPTLPVAPRAATPPPLPAQVPPSPESPTATDDEVTRSVAALRSIARSMQAVTDIAPAAAATPPRPAPVAPDAGALAAALAAGGLRLFLQPIAALGDRRAAHIELSAELRLGDDHSLTGPALTAAAAEQGLLPRIDTAKLAATVGIVEQLTAKGQGTGILSLVSTESLIDDAYLDQLATVTDEDSQLSRHLVPAFAQAEIRALSLAQWETLETMAQHGFRFTLEGVTDLDMDFERLKAKGFDYVKLDAEVFLVGLPAPGGTSIPAADICRWLSGQGFTLIVGRIDDERQLAEVMGFGVLLGQGALFGAPKPMRADLVRGVRVAA